MRATLERLVLSQSPRATFEFTGELSDEELRARMHACDVFVLPSVTPAEAFGFVQLEAMAAGKPVVSTRVRSGVPWVNRHGQSGVIVEPGDVEGLRRTLAALIADRELRAQLGAGGGERVREQFGIRDMADRFVALCEEVAREQS
jgi:glycosyltransferase involved in cell wall biosynthesis